MQFPTNTIGFLPEIVGAAAKAFTSGGQPPVATGQGGMPGTEPSVPRQPAAVTTVSPAIQTQVSPQISPTMVQQQSSPGATVGASPQQYMPGGMQADRGVSPAGHWAPPGLPGTQPGIDPLQPYTGVPGAYAPITGPMPTIPQVTRQGPRGLPQWLLPAALVGGAALIAVMTRRRRGARAK